MRKSIALLLLVLLSCSPNSLQWQEMEMIYIEMNRPEVYHWVSGDDPGKGYEEFPCNMGPYIVRISGKIIEVDVQKPIKKVQHLRGKYGSDAVEIEIINETSFRVMITDPDPYAETFRIFF